MFAEQARRGAGARTMHGWPLWARVLTVYVLGWVLWTLLDWISDPLDQAMRFATWMVVFFLAIDAAIVIGRHLYARREA